MPETESPIDLSEAAVTRFLAKLNDPTFLESCARDTGCTLSETRILFRLYGGEVAVGAALLRHLDLRGKKVLEVGAGIGLQTSFIHGAGANLEALEPQGVGFDLNHKFLDVLSERFSIPRNVIHRIGAEDLRPDREGPYDVIFSVNVLEHVAKLDEALGAMSRVLAPDGIMIHTCPNYAIPYEPHYALPLFPFAPEWTPWAGARRREPVWKSLNFITADRLKRISARHGLNTSFAPGVMADVFDRVRKDDVFAARHASLKNIATILFATGGLALLRHWPPGWSTPMRVQMSKTEAVSFWRRSS